MRLSQALHISVCGVLWWHGAINSDKMKKIILLLIFLPLSVFSQKKDWDSFKFKTKETDLNLKYAQTQEETDTLLLNNKIYKVLAVGNSTSCYDVTGNVWEYTYQVWFITDSNSRETYKNAYKERFEVYMNKAQNRIIKLVRFADGVYVKTYR